MPEKRPANEPALHLHGGGGESLWGLTGNDQAEYQGVEGQSGACCRGGRVQAHLWRGR